LPTGAPSASGNSRRRAIDWQRLQQWAAREWHQEITVADLARRVHLSPTQFTARRRDELGLGAIAWLRQQRLAHARLLRASGMPVAAVA
ncbi:helix-turn-helix domain-containing protein, partial [Acinetobacter baumannii]